MTVFPPLRPGVALLAAALSGTAMAQAVQTDELAHLINAYRGAPTDCAGHAAAPALTVEPALAAIRIGRATFLESALTQAGYPADRADALTVSGAANAREVLDVLRQKYCAKLLDPGFAAVGTAHMGGDWQVVLAHPFVAPALPDPQEAGQQILALVNAARAQPRTCGTQAFGAAPALAWNPLLARAAFAHSDDMARKRYFDHRQPDGSVPADRATRAGYAWRAVGENIASGQRGVDEVVASWLDSPGHCANIMNPAFTEMGAAWAIDPANQYHTVYWTQVFGRPR